MVKGISKQVIVVNSADRKMFEQAIFILSDDAIKGNGISNEKLLKEANRILRDSKDLKQKSIGIWRIVYVLLGAVTTGILWWLSVFL